MGDERQYFDLAVTSGKRIASKMQSAADGDRVAIPTAIRRHVPHRARTQWAVSDGGRRISECQRRRQSFQELWTLFRCATSYNSNLSGWLQASAEGLIKGQAFAYCRYGRNRVYRTSSDGRFG